MKNIFSRTFSSLPKRLATAAILAMAIILPVAATAASTVKIEADSTIANASNGETWKTATTADYNDVVDVQVVYLNDEAADSGKVASNLRVKIDIPTKAGVDQTINTSTSADNSNTVKGNVSVKLSRADAYLQYIPGTATWKHAETANGPRTVTQKVSDDVVMNSNGLVLENENPCQAGSIQVQARVMVPGLTVDKYVRHQGDTNWATSIAAKVGDTVQYEIAYHNTGNTVQNDVEFRDQMPKGVSYVPGSTKLKSGNYPNGLDVTSNALVASNGITVGDYAPGAAGYVMFDAKVTGGDALKCGDNTLRNLAFVQPTDMNYYYNTADVVVNKVCAEKPQYSCDAFGLTVNKEDRSVDVNKFDYTAKNGAQFNNVVIDWGDQSEALTTDKAVGKTHSYAKDGSYTVTATAHFTADGKDVTSSGSCQQTVSFTTPSTPTTPTTTPPTELPNTGAGAVISLFGAVSVAGAVMYRLFLSRRSARQ